MVAAQSKTETATAKGLKRNKIDVLKKKKHDYIHTHVSKQADAAINEMSSKTRSSVKNIVHSFEPRRRTKQKCFANV